MKKVNLLVLVLVLATFAKAKESSKLTALSQIFVSNIPLLQSMKKNNIQKDINVRD